MVKTLEIQMFFSGTKKALGLNVGIWHRGLKLYLVCSNDDHRLTFDLLKPRSNLHLYRFVWGEKLEKSFFFNMYLRLMAETYNV